MIDNDTLVVSYDKKRGDPRGKRKKDSQAEQKLGSCIDCKLCVQVCPTGIDIRNGLQYECIGCAACIDACDSIMDQMGYDRGLVRYSTENAINGVISHIFRPRMIIYGVILCVMIAGFFAALVNRVPLEVDIIRDRNQLYRTNIQGHIENVYTLKIMNKTQQHQSYKVSISGIESLELNTPATVRALPGELVTIPTSAHIDPKMLSRPNIDVFFHVEANDDPSIYVKEESRFISPRQKRS